ncbi:MAG: hypothetical protein P3B76_07690 [Gemmatimonadota bacterium]|nr:hypothetical protein [Gemmatimonadota bacterium]MDQ8172549.1 hypothetical protein [Gemmatimonadota bacterium]
MREYRFQATPESVEALRQLRGAWRGLLVAEHHVTVVLQDQRAVRIQCDTADVESLFDAYRLQAEVESAEGMYGVPVEAFASGNNDIVLFTGVTWSEPHGAVRAEGMAEGAVMHFSGHPGQLSDTAEVVCVTTDAFVIAAGDGSGMLIRTGLRPGSVEVERNPEKVRAFLVDRGYSAA